MKKFLRLSLVFLLSCVAILATSAFYTPVERISVKEGLSNNFVNGLTIDKYNNVWIATEEGLSRIDGSDIEIYLKSAETIHQGPAGDALNTVLAIEDDVWIATQRQGLSRYSYSTGKFVTYQHNEDSRSTIATNDITALAPAEEGKLWVGTYHCGVDRLDTATGECEHFNAAAIHGMPSNQVRALLAATDGFLYVGHFEHGLTVFDPVIKTARNYRMELDGCGIPNNCINVIKEDNKGRIWIGTGNGLCVLDKETRKIRKVNLSIKNRDTHDVTAIFFPNPDKIWTAISGLGIVEIEVESIFTSLLTKDAQIVRTIPHGSSDKGIGGSTVNDMALDEFGNLWLATWGGGVNMLPRLKPWFHMVGAEAYANQEYSGLSLCMGAQGQLLIGTDGNGLLTLNAKGGLEAKKADLTDNRLISQMLDSKGRLWVAQYRGGIRVLNEDGKAISNLPVPTEARCLVERDGEVWAATSSGLYVFDLETLKEKRQIMPTFDFSLLSMARTIAFDSIGNLWVGAFDNGIWKFDSNLNVLGRWTDNSGFPTNDVRHIIIDRRGRLWAATDQGLAMLDNPLSNVEPKLFRRSEGVVNTNIRALVEDDEGNIWFSTNRGIGRVRSTADSVSFYTFADGIAPGEFLDRSVVVDSLGNLCFGSTAGMCVLSPNSITDSIIVPSVRFTTLAINFDPTNDKYSKIDLFGNKKIHLASDQNTFSISFNNADYSLNGKMQYAYRLQGLDKEWRLIGDDNKLSFLNLSPGEYNLEVKSRLSQGQWRKERATLALAIEPPFYQTWWAKLIYLIVAVLIIWYIVKAYKHNLKIKSSYEIEKQKLVFLTNITHELRTPLTLILGPLEDLKSEKEIPQQYKGKLDVIHQSALRLLDLINEILEFRKTEMQGRQLVVKHENLAKTVYDAGLKYQELNTNPNVKLEISIEEGDWNICYDAMAVTTIIDNLLSNAIKYTPSGTIKLSLRRMPNSNPKEIEIAVSDTGYGVPQNELEHIFERYYQGHGEHQQPGTGIGLALSKNLADLHQASLLVESAEGVGTKFMLRLLADNTYPDAVHADINDSIKEQDGKAFEGENGSDKRPVLLIVEDNGDIINYISMSFESFFDVIAATNGKAGLELAINRIPDIIVSDVMMPEMDGIEMCRTLKKDIRTSHIPVILLTAKNAPGDKEDGYKAGADSYLTKPFSSTLLHSRINNLLETRRRFAAKTAEAVSMSSVQSQPEKPEAETKKKQMSEALNKIDTEFINGVTKIIEDNIASDKLNIEFVAEHMCMSTSSLYRKMRALTGISTNEFIRRIRMRHAEELLLSRKYSISEIAFALGFNTPGYFRQCFKDEFGCTPSDYLKRLGSKSKTAVVD